MWEGETPRVTEVRKTWAYPWCADLRDCVVVSRGRCMWRTGIPPKWGEGERCKMNGMRTTVCRVQDLYCMVGRDRSVGLW